MFSKEGGGFRPLFNGRDLSGWVEQGDPNAFIVENGTLVLKNPRYYPNWLRTEKEFENFELSLEYRMPGWSEAGLLLHAPLYGRVSKTGIKIHLRHDNQDEGSHSVGGIYGVLPPLALAAEKKKWNRLEVYLNWPSMRVLLNGTIIQNTDLSRHPELRWRLRRGFIGLQDLGREIHFRNIRIHELPSREEWTELFNGEDLGGWGVQGEAKWSVEDGMIVARNGDGYLITESSFSSFEFQVFVRTSRYANGGVFYRWVTYPRRRGYEVQIYNILDTTNPTGSIYGLVPAEDPDSQDGQWFLMQIVSDGNFSTVRIDGKRVAESDSLTVPDRGSVALQMHSQDARIEFLRPRIKRLR
ncbi:MAG: 3-keto-disaccharide hydrolase [bacterium]